MQPKFNLWLETETNEVFLSIWRVALLQAVHDTGSISAAAHKMGIHYRTAWQKIHEMETRLGAKLVETQTGGSHGGGAALTPLALEYLDKFGRFSADISQAIQTAYHTHF